DRNKKIIETAAGHSKELETAVFDAMLKDKNPLAMQVVSGARGSKGNLRSVAGSDILYEDHHQNALPIPILRSYAEGLSPVEYWAGTYGTRKGVVDLKFATQDAGFFGKQLNQATHRLVVTA